MSPEITLQPMTRVMYHTFFKEYENDPDLYLDKRDFCEYQYNPARVDAYAQRQLDLHRLPFAIMYGDEIVGELKLYDIIPHQSASLGITVKNKACKGRGFGTQAERLIIRYAFDVLDIPVLYADSVLTNTRSQHVLEKVGFRLISTDAQRKHYRVDRDTWAP